MGYAPLPNGHVGLNVTDLERSLAFYRKVFDLKTFVESDEDGKRFALLGVGDDLTITLWEQSEGEFSPKAPGLHHLSFQAPDIETVQAAEAVLRELGATIFHDGIVPHGEGGSSGGVFFADPDGIRLEIYAPSGADTAPAPTKGAPTCGFF
ncbi:VOC family protein [Glycomyces sp. NPDC046736]|uniref:VOC family protein n=1 Tax=Glycomyces sp. NPDC046736 TaxID=3155615 RepID=UPI0033FF9B7D